MRDFNVRELHWHGGLASARSLGGLSAGGIYIQAMMSWIGSTSSTPTSFWFRPLKK